MREDGGIEDLERVEPIRKRRLAAHAMVLRRQRIFRRLREGLAYEEIANQEGLSTTRIRQIVSETLEKRTIESGAEHAKLQLDRLAPAMQLAADAIHAGDVAAIGPFLRVLDRLDRYSSIAGVTQVNEEDARQRLFNKINRVAANLGVDDEWDEARRELQERKAAVVAEAVAEAGMGGRSAESRPAPAPQEGG